jgi:mannosylglycerate hydrolase
MATPPPSVLVVSHTHWDREWYHTAERFRQRLVALVDDLLDAPPPAPRSFLLDGQAVLLDDYLAVRPERAAELSTLLRDGRLEAGPWYVLADELIPSGEALVRNLLAGRAAVRRLRGEPPPVLWCPDSFGHPAVLPDLAAGFGCAVIVLWRGYGGARWPAGDTVHWRGAALATVLVHHLPPDGYEFGSSLPAGAADATSRWRRIADALLPRAATGIALLLNGADHHARQRDLDAALDALATAAAPVPVTATTLREASAAIEAAAAPLSLPTVEGELRDSYGYTWTLAGTLGTRAAQKRANALAERLLLRDVEPWIALGDASPSVRALLDVAWRDLLLAHPHDTLCGTSIDEVAVAFDERIRRVAVQAEGLRDDALHSLARHDAERARGEVSAWRPMIALRNPSPRPRGGVAEIMVEVKIADVAVGPGSAARQGRRVEPDAGWLVLAGLQSLDMEHRVVLTESPRAYPDADLVERRRVLAWVPPIAGYALDVRMPASLGEHHAPGVVRVHEDALECGALRATVGAGGEVRLEDLATGRAIDDLLSFQLSRDAGDLYTPAIRERVGALRFEGVDVVHPGPLRGELAIRFRDEDDGSTVVLRVGLDAGLPALRVALDGVNARRDARLRLLVRTGAADGVAVTADAAFHPSTRSALRVSPADDAMERVVPTAPLHRFVTRFGAAEGTTLYSDGLAEYEAGADGTVAVTLLRAVGQLSRPDLPERPGHAGWPADTPAAQCLGAWSARFAVALHGPDSPAQRDDIERLADDVLLPLRGEMWRSSLGPPRRAGGLELEGAHLAFSAAMPARRAGWIVLRCVNRSRTPVTGRWRLDRGLAEAVRARLDEVPGAPITIEGTTIPFTAAPLEIVTILARLADD